MAQLSVPFIDLDNNGQSNTNQPVGALTFWEALSEDDLTSYSSQHLGPVALLGFTPISAIAIGLQPIFDPGVDTGFTLRFIARKIQSGTPVGALIGDVILRSNFGGAGLFIYLTHDLWTILNSTFTLIEIPLEVDVVQAIRDNDAWGDLYIILEVQSSNFAVGVDPNTDFDFAFLQLEAPDGGPTPPDIEIIGGPGLTLTGTGLYGNGISFPPVLVNGPTLGVKIGKLAGTNTFVTGPTLGITGSSYWPHSEFIGGPNLELNHTRRPILSINVSGLYTFVTDKTNDTLYTGNITPGQTMDVKIPRPFGKTSFVGG